MLALWSRMRRDSVKKPTQHSSLGYFTGSAWEVSSQDSLAAFRSRIPHFPDFQCPYQLGAFIVLLNDSPIVVKKKNNLSEHEHGTSYSVMSR